MDRYFGFLRILLISVIALSYLIFLAPWNKGTITVTGTSKLDQAPQTATYMATVSIDDDNKDTAVNSVNTKMTAIIDSLKAFGVKEEDIQTSQVSVYENAQPEILIYPPRDVKTKKWQATNSITIKLRDTSKASSLTDLLNSSGATNISGPNFAIEDTKSSDAELLTRAIEDARAKATKMAEAGGRRLGKMITVTEGYSSFPYPVSLTAEKAADSRTSAPIEPGTETLSKTVTVIFELK